MKKAAALSISFGVILFAAAVIAEAQQLKKVFRVGILENVSSPRTDAFRQGLRELGYMEGQNLVIESRFGSDDRLPDLADELVRLKVDVIFAPMTNELQAAENATRTIPIVMATPSDPIGSGFIASLAHPGGNVTGLTSIFGELSAKRLELFKEAVPKITRVAVLADPAIPNYAAVVKGLEETAGSLRLKLQILEVRHPGDLDNAFSAISRDRVEALFMAPAPVFFAESRQIANFSSKRRLPSSCTSGEYAEVGCLMSYGVSQTDSFRRAAYFVDKILKGAKPGDLPVQQPTKFELVINLRTAKQIGVTIPQSVLYRADRVIR